jgi:hypothetical protein
MMLSTFQFSVKQDTCSHYYVINSLLDNLGKKCDLESLTSVRDLLAAFQP